MKRPGSLVFYIGNGVVKGGLVVHEKGKIPRILCTRTKDLPHYHERDREHLESRILTEFAELVRDFKTKDVPTHIAQGVKIKHAMVLMASPWYVSETTIIKMKEPKPFLVTEKLLLDSKENIVKGYRDAHKVDVTVLEQKILRVSLNGYPTTDPLKKKAESLDMTVFTSFARHSSVEEIKKIVEQNFHVSEVAIHSQSLVSFSVIGDTWKDTNQYIIADITSELTELVAVRNGALSEATSFPMGKQYLIKAVGDSMGVSSEVATSIIKMKNESRIEVDLANKVDKALLEVQKEWLKLFTDALVIMSSSTSLPNMFFLFAPKGVANIFAKFITEEEYQQFSFTEGKFEVHQVSTNDLTTNCANALSVNADVSMMIAAIYSNKMFYN